LTTLEVNLYLILSFVLVAVYVAKVVLQMQYKWLMLKGKNVLKSTLANVFSVTNVLRTAPEVL